MTGQATFAPFVLARVGGISARRLDALSLEKTVELIQVAKAAAARLKPLEDALDDVLYRLVPHCGDDQALRRCVLRVKRHVHNSRLWSEATADIDRVATAMADAGERATLLEWQRLAAARDAALAEAADEYQREMTAAGEAIADGMSNTDLQAGLGLASPGALAEVLRALDARRADDWRPGSKLARASLGYLMRAALKTSPFSSFTQVAIASLGPHTLAADPASRQHLAGTERGRPDAAREDAPQRISRLVRMLPLSWLLLVARDRELATALTFEPNAGLLPRATGQTIGVLTTDYAVAGSFAGRRERVAERKFDPSRMPALASWLAEGRRVSYAELTAIVRASGITADPRDAVVRLLDAQLVRPVAPHAQQEPEPLAALARALSTIGSGRASRLAALMRGVQNMGNACGRADGAARVRLLARIRRTAALIFDVLGAGAPAWLDEIGLLYEDVRFAGRPIELPPSVAEDLDSVARELRPHMIRGHLYDAIYSHFVRRFGESGEATDVLEFLHTFLDREDFGEVVNRALADDRLALRGEGRHARARLSAGRSAAPPSASVFFQIAATDEDALRRGDYRLVVNETSGGQGGLMARFADVLGPGSGDLAGRLASWVEASRDGREALELTVINDCNNLHPIVGATRRVIEWPAECPTTDVASGSSSAINLRELRLRAHAADETLYFVDRSGREVAPCYLGLVPPAHFRNALGLLLFLIDPWVSDAESGFRRDGRQGANTPPGGVEFHPRREVGRVVLRRARWRLRASDLPLRQKGETDFDFFVRVQDWRAEHGLPQRVFVSVERNQVELDPKYRKPISVSFVSPHTLELLRHFVTGDTQVVTMTEVLPAPDEHWVAAPNGDASGPRVSELISLVRWPMPEPVAAQPPADERSQPRPDADGWLYYTIHPGTADRLDDVVRRIVAPAIDGVRRAGALGRWFFVRYIDRHGPHIRLRIKVPAERRDEVHRDIAARIERELPCVRPLDVPPLLQFADRQSERPAPALRWTPRWTTACYEPEYDKYGGATGVQIAERLFEASSALAVRVVLSGAVRRDDRGRVCLRSMRDLVDAFHRDRAEADAFLANYIWYWSGQDRAGAADLRAQIEAAGRRDGGQLWSDHAIADEPSLAAMTDEYRLAIEQAARDVARAGLSVPATRLCFDYLHMNHNRLGLRPADEVYLASVIQRSSPV